MDKLDHAYLTELVQRSRQGDSNAFAELYTATCQRHYAYLYEMLGDERAAADTLKKAMIHALHGLSGLTSPELYMPWVCRICYRLCETDRDTPVKTPAGSFRPGELLQLPLAEAQVLLMHYGQGLPAAEIEDILNFSPGLVRRCLKSGEKRLLRDRAGEQTRAESGQKPREFRISGRRTLPELDAVTAADILNEVFDSCGRKPNTIPTEALSSYALYRKERFSLQRGVLAGALTLFLLVPLMFVLPRFEVSREAKGERGLPVYTVEVHSALPVGSVTARLRSRSLPVYEADRKRFTVEPIRNGTMTVRVELFNHQAVQNEYEVSEVDAEGPKLEDSRIGSDTVVLVVRDAGIGVNYRKITAIGISGAVYAPISTDEEKGEVLFSYPEEDWDVYIPDYIGNTLHLALSLK